MEAKPHLPLPNKEHALGERRRMALPGASVMSVARPTSVRHCAVTVKSMHGAFVLVVVGSQMCAVAHPGTHAPRGRRCCAGVTPGFQESCCCVQPINSGFRLRVFRSIVQRHAVRERLSREETTTPLAPSRLPAGYSPPCASIEGVEGEISRPYPYSICIMICICICENAEGWLSLVSFCQARPSRSSKQGRPRRTGTLSRPVAAGLESELHRSATCRVQVAAVVLLGHWNLRHLSVERHGQAAACRALASQREAEADRAIP